MSSFESGCRIREQVRKRLTSVYIYMVPVITVVTSVLVLKEPVTWVSVAGTVLAVARLSLSEYHGKGRELDE